MAQSFTAEVDEQPSTFLIKILIITQSVLFLAFLRHLSKKKSRQNNTSITRKFPINIVDAEIRHKKYFK